MHVHCTVRHLSLLQTEWSCFAEQHPLGTFLGGIPVYCRAGFILANKKHGVTLKVMHRALHLVHLRYLTIALA